MSLRAFIEAIASSSSEGAVALDDPPPTSSPHRRMRATETELASSASLPTIATHRAHARTRSWSPQPRSWEYATRFLEHALQTHLPHTLQWCRLRVSPNASPQQLQFGPSGSQLRRDNGLSMEPCGGDAEINEDKTAR